MLKNLTLNNFSHNSRSRIYIIFSTNEEIDVHRNEINIKNEQKIVDKFFILKFCLISN